MPHSAAAIVAGGPKSAPARLIVQTDPVGEVILRPIEEADLSVLRRIQVDPDASGEFEWFGFQPAKANETESREKSAQSGS